VGEGADSVLRNAAPSEKAGLFCPVGSMAKEVKFLNALIEPWDLSVACDSDVLLFLCSRRSSQAPSGVLGVGLILAIGEGAISMLLCPRSSHLWLHRLDRRVFHRLCL
jgi:hypothetical protein